MRKPRSVTSQVMWSAVEGSVRATIPAILRPRPAPGSSDDGRRRVGEQRVRDHLLEVVLRGLDVQAGQLAAEHHRRAGPRGDEVADRGQARDRGVAAHVPDEQPLQARRHAQVAGQPDVEAGGGVAGAGDDGEQADVPGRQAGGVQRAGDRLLAQRQRLGDVALHPGAGAPLAEVLVQRAGHRMPAADAGSGEDPAGGPHPLVVPGEVPLPDGVLVDRRGESGARARDDGAAHKVSGALGLGVICPTVRRGFRLSRSAARHRLRP